MIDGATDAVSEQEDPEPGEVLHHKQWQHLEGHKAQNPPLQVGVIAEEFLDLWVFFCGCKMVLYVLFSASACISVGGANFLYLSRSGTPFMVILAILHNFLWYRNIG